MVNIILSIIWSDILSLVLICFSTVLTIMGLFVGLISIFRLFKDKKTPVAQQPEEQQTIQAEKPEVKISDVEYAVIATAIHLYFNNNDHDDESNILTIKNIRHNYSPWRLNNN
ncbi:MAG: OadG family protein [Bacteroidales bacterium]|jgi:hypothetical protein|nr:OadG family protein [Bacteroidales bacterium]